MTTNRSTWTFFSNHGHVYFLLATRKDIVLREVAQRVGITERAVYKIVQELEEAGFLRKEKEGRVNRYIIEPDRTLRHPLEENVLLEDLVALLKASKDFSD